MKIRFIKILTGERSKSNVGALRRGSTYVSKGKHRTPVSIFLTLRGNFVAGPPLLFFRGQPLTFDTGTKKAKCDNDVIFSVS
jgi:transcriptional regulator of met regulon